MGQCQRIGDWVFDRDDGRLSGPAGERRLDPRLSRLLALLADEPGRVFSVDAILERVWPDVVVTASSVYQAITVLRQQLDDTGSPPRYVATLPRRGYRLIAPVSAAVDVQTDESVASAVVLPSPLAAEAPVTVASAASSWWSAVPCLVLLLVAVVGVWRYGGSTSPHLTGRPQTVVLLPLAESGAEAGHAVAGSLSNDLRRQLAGSSGVRVIDVSSTEVTAVAREETQASADFVLSGSVQHIEDRLAIRLSLKSVQAGRPVWLYVGTVPADRLARWRDESVRAIRQALQVAQPRGSEESVPEPSRAYFEFLLGQEAAEEDTRASLTHAIDHLQRAIDINPAYAEAYAALTYPELRLYDRTRDATLLDAAALHAEQAIRLAPGSPDGFAARANFRLWQRQDWEGAGADFKRALSLGTPGFSLLLHYADYQMALGHADRAIEAVQSALAVEPVNVHGWMKLAVLQEEVGQYAQALASIDRAARIDEESPYLMYQRGLIAILSGHPDQALLLAPSINGSYSALRERVEIMAVWSQGHHEDARARLAKHAPELGVREPIEVAETYAWIGDREAAFLWLDRSVEAKDHALAYLKLDPFLVGLHSDPRFAALVGRLKLPP